MRMDEVDNFTVELLSKLYERCEVFVVVHDGHAKKLVMEGGEN